MEASRDAALRTLKAQAEVLETELKKGEVKAPQDGMVLEVHGKVGQPASPAAPLMRVMASGPRHIEVYVRSEDAQDLSPGMQAQAIREGRTGETNFPAIIRRLGMTAVERISPLGLVETRILVELDAEGLAAYVPGSSLDVRFTTHREEEVLVIPRLSVFKRDGQDTVWVVRNDAAALQEVSLGLEGELHVVVTGGLQAGDRVVRDPNTPGLHVGKKVAAQAP